MTTVILLISGDQEGNYKEMEQSGPCTVDGGRTLYDIKRFKHVLRFSTEFNEKCGKWTDFKTHQEDTAD